jgi:hypothetical protein
MDHAKKMYGQLLKAGGKTAAFFEPANTAFNHIATTIAFLIIAERSSRTAFPTSFAWRYDRTDAMRTQPVANALGVIGFITTDAPRSRARPSFPSLHLYAPDQGFKLG